MCGVLGDSPPTFFAIPHSYVTMQIPKVSKAYEVLVYRHRLWDGVPPRCHTGPFLPPPPSPAADSAWLMAAPSASTVTKLLL